MYTEFRTLVKDEGLRGWRLDEENAEFYFSRFDDRFNDDEFRFYLSVSDDRVQIKRMQKIKSYRKLMKVDPHNTYAQEATAICRRLTELKQAAREAANQLP